MNPPRMMKVWILVVGIENVKIILNWVFSVEDFGNTSI